MSSFVNIIQDRDGTDYYLKATIPSVESTAESVATTDPVSVDVDVDSDGVVSFDFHIPAASTANADAAAQEARDAADACEAATSAANTAATGATTAAQNAVNATVDTVHATQEARTAITDTQAATASANTAASDANTAKDATIAATTAANSATTAATTATSNANTATTNATTATASAITAAGAANTAATDAAQAVAALQAYVPLDADNILKASETGAIVSTDDAYPSPLLGLVAYGNSVQNGTPTPESPVPIKSVAGVKAVCAGENLYDLNTAASYSSTSGATITISGGKVTFSGVITSIQHSVAVAVGNGVIGHVANYVNYVPIKEDTSVLLEPGTYTLLGEATFAVNTVAKGVYGNLDNTIQSGGSSVSLGQTFTITTPKWFSFIIGTTTNMGDTNVSIFVTDVALVRGDGTGAVYTPYIGSSTPLTLIDDQGVAHELRSVPEGTRDELILNADGSGTLIANLIGATIDGSSNQWSKHQSQNGKFQIRTSFIGLGELLASGTNAALFDRYAVSDASYGSMPYGTAKISILSDHSYIYLAISEDLTSIDQLKAYLDANPFFFVAKLVTPATYTIPAINMPSLPDLVSNAWISATDANGAAIAADIGITYRRDINTVIDRIDQRIADTQGTIAPVEGSTASANYAVGSYLVHDDVLYKVTAAIARNEAIVPGTNVTATTVMAEIAAING